MSCISCGSIYIIWLWQIEKNYCLPAKVYFDHPRLIARLGLEVYSSQTNEALELEIAIYGLESIYQDNKHGFDGQISEPFRHFSGGIQSTTIKLQ